MKNLKLLGFSLMLVVMLPSCVNYLMPKKQKITITTDNEKTEVYANGVQIGKGKTSTTKIEKDGTQQIVVKTPNYADEYLVLRPEKRDPVLFPMMILDVPLHVITFGLGLAGVLTWDAGFKYAKIQSFSSKTPLLERAQNEKYIELEAIKINIKDKNKDIEVIEVSHSRGKDLGTEIKTAEQNKVANDIKAEAKAAKKKKKEKILLEEGKKDITYDDSKFSDELYDLLKKTKFVDTTKTVFSDNNNTLTIEGAIKKVKIYDITERLWTHRKSKIDIDWFFKNSYGEILDSIRLSTFSGEHKREIYGAEFVKKHFETMYSDAVAKSYFELKNTSQYKKHIELENSIKINDALLTINKPNPNSVVKEVSDATQASVIIKRKDKGHGSGFAISNDGYVLTNFHVVAGKHINQQEEISVVLSNGIEIPAKVVRFNRATDIALLKVDYAFEKIFELKSSKDYKNYMEAYTVGAPKSVELGQTVTLGLISNERIFNNISLLQLSMSVNFGNSGGPLFDKQGNLHGVIQSKLVGFSTEGVGFAIPAYLIPEYLNISIK